MRYLVFPGCIRFKTKSFLWADDLSSYDSILELPFNIPFYGDHISLFPILASVAIFIYDDDNGTTTTTSTAWNAKHEVYYVFNAFNDAFFFNNYSSGLSLYYFVSNLLTILLMVVIKKFVVNESKILTPN